MKKLLATILIFVIIAGVMVITCPDRQQHETALQEVIDYSFDKSVADDDTGIAYVASIFGSKLMNIFLDRMLRVDNYFIVSIGKVELPNGKSRQVSLGVLGHVFTIDRDKALQILEEEKIL